MELMPHSGEANRGKEALQVHVDYDVATGMKNSVRHRRAAWHKAVRCFFNGQLLQNVDKYPFLSGRERSMWCAQRPRSAGLLGNLELHIMNAGGGVGVITEPA